MHNTVQLAAVAIFPTTSHISLYQHKCTVC